MEGYFICKECDQDYVPNKKGFCHPDTSIKNCELASSDTLCDECKDGFVLVDRKCEQEKITNCAEYGNEELMDHFENDYWGPYS